MAIFVDLSDPSGSEGEDEPTTDNRTPGHDGDLARMYRHQLTLRLEKTHQHGGRTSQPTSGPAGKDSVGLSNPLVRLLCLGPILQAVSARIDMTTAVSLSQTCKTIRDLVIGVAGAARRTRYIHTSLDDASRLPMFSFMSCDAGMTAQPNRTCPRDWVRQCIRCSRPVCRNCNGHPSGIKRPNSRMFVRHVCLACESALTSVAFSGRSPSAVAAIKQRDPAEMYGHLAKKRLQMRRIAIALAALNKGAHDTGWDQKRNLVEADVPAHSIWAALRYEEMPNSWFYPRLAPHDVSATAPPPTRPRVFFCQCQHDAPPICPDLCWQIDQRIDLINRARGSQPCVDPLSNAGPVDKAGYAVWKLAGSPDCRSGTSPAQNEPESAFQSTHRICAMLEDCVDRRWAQIWAPVEIEPDSGVESSFWTANQAEWSCPRPTTDIFAAPPPLDADQADQRTDGQTARSDKPAYLGWLPAPLQGWDRKQRSTVGSSTHSQSTFEYRVMAESQLTDPDSVLVMESYPVISLDDPQLTDEPANKDKEPTLSVASVKLCSWCDGVILVVFKEIDPVD